jgi:hypothetical protein
MTITVVTATIIRTKASKPTVVQNVPRRKKDMDRPLRCSLFTLEGEEHIQL